jgi:hypothetical protein
MAQTQQRRASNGSRPRASSVNGSRSGRKSGTSGTSGSGAGDLLKQGARKTTRVAQKSGTPAIAAGAALAGLAAGAALASRGRFLLDSLPGTARSGASGRGTAKTLLRASQQLHSTSCNLNDLAGEIRRVRELAQAGQNRSPIEVVLQGLTRRPEQ